MFGVEYRFVYRTGTCEGTTKDMQEKPCNKIKGNSESRRGRGKLYCGDDELMMVR